MESDKLYSIRMRASNRGQHLSGAEKIVPERDIAASLSDLAARAVNRATMPDEIVFRMDEIEQSRIHRLPAINVTTIKTPDWISGRICASKVLGMNGVSERAVNFAIKAISKGANMYNGNMRGAMIINALTGQRMEPDSDRGIRATRFDWSAQAGREIDGLLAGIGLTHFRTREALALATKIAHTPGVLAELCWSDDPHYTAGYVASLKTGYIRFPFLKQEGDQKGGRAIFISPSADVRTLICYLQESVCIIDSVGICNPAVESEEYFKSLL